MTTITRAIFTPDGFESVPLTDEELAEFHAAEAEHEAGRIPRAKAAKSAELNAAREAAESTFTHQGTVFDADAKSLTYINNIWNIVLRSKAMPPNWIGYWKAADNSQFPITTVAQWNAFTDSMISAGLDAFVTSEALKAKLAQAATEDEINAITWPNKGGV